MFASSNPVLTFYVYITKWKSCIETIFTYFSWKRTLPRFVTENTKCIPVIQLRLDMFSAESFYYSLHSLVSLNSNKNKWEILWLSSDKTCLTCIGSMTDMAHGCFKISRFPNGIFWGTVGMFMTANMIGMAWLYFQDFFLKYFFWIITCVY